MVIYKLFVTLGSCIRFCSIPVGSGFELEAYQSDANLPIMTHDVVHRLVTTKTSLLFHAQTFKNVFEGFKYFDLFNRCVLHMFPLVPILFHQRKKMFSMKMLGVYLNKI